MTCEQTTGVGPGEDEDESDEEEEECSGPRLVHVYPTFGRVHEIRLECWCHPRVEWDGGIPFLVHEIHH